MAFERTQLCTRACAINTFEYNKVMQNIHLCPLRVSFPLKTVQHVHPRRKCNAHVYTALQNKTAYRKNQTVVPRTKVPAQSVRASFSLLAKISSLHHQLSDQYIVPTAQNCYRRRDYERARCTYPVH
ncbi:hypothetical protein TPADAL_0353a [Treponema pallidum subsp. pallidum DAL-1]|uniref:Uncharacterized protein n=2 Tax=Treponema pallidum TaxID=160 RepID=A0AAU8RPV7_TREPL|nr:hypothetical protein TPESAMD_0353a [Treponema pallidum subsp. pertenue str. SamoaD]AEZ58541.1 hypothetical protein TPECDC2_0353a [Treponema pallidum subsp. pertenue str. CDC2]AEZ59609.1 hypothetical protein TPEGAU_0353a [Treponema pallidum subsp. pertenue str. Gauthier]AEZ60673.1 hypothetical protein TPADAL_0353a [Treponema pallidum subsp. pallidum DAL-1]AGK83996.1 hypothetical protein TPFB_0353a [Treponema pallidum str. Fribourg-Blanc]AJB40370.1 hypothetical protein TENDBA_0353a [Treponema